MAEICNLIGLNGTLDLTSTSGVLKIKLDRLADLIISECFVEVTTQISGSTTAPVVALKKGNLELATITLANGTVVGKMKFFPATNIPVASLGVDDEISVVCKTAAAGSPAGAIRAFVGVK